MVWSSPLVALPLLLAAPMSPVARVDDDGLLDDARIWAIAEIDILGELGAFTDDALARGIADGYPTPGSTRADLIELLELTDDVNADLLLELRIGGYEVSDAVIHSLAPLSEETWQRIDDGERGFLDPRPWLDAATDLIVREGARAETPGGDQGAIFDYLGVGAPATPDGSPVPAPPTTAAGVGTPAPTPADDSGSLRPLIVSVACAVVAFTVAVLRRRRRRRQTTHERHDLLDSSRRLAGALDAGEVQRIAVADAVRATGADRGAFFAAHDSGLRLVAADGEAAATEAAIDPVLLSRVVETGQPETAQVADPRRRGARVGVAVTPVISGREVIGALAVLRSSPPRFTTAEMDGLRLLVPVVGSALAASARHDSVVQDAERDGLTDLHNRRRLDRDLAVAAGRVAFAMVDVDHFKAFNDTHGHGAGDEALRSVARVLAENVRTDDVVYRYGGEEFSVLLPGATTEEAVEVLERVRRAVAGTELRDGGGRPIGRVTISVGIVASDGGIAGGELARQADRALYDAKTGGRNRTVTSTTV